MNGEQLCRMQAGSRIGTRSLSHASFHLVFFLLKSSSDSLDHSCCAICMWPAACLTIKEVRSQFYRKMSDIYLFPFHCEPVAIGTVIQLIKTTSAIKSSGNIVHFNEVDLITEGSGELSGLSALSGSLPTLSWPWEEESGALSGMGFLLGAERGPGRERLWGKILPGLLPEEKAGEEPCIPGP